MNCRLSKRNKQLFLFDLVNSGHVSDEQILLRSVALTICVCIWVSEWMCVVCNFICLFVSPFRICILVSIPLHCLFWVCYFFLLVFLFITLGCLESPHSIGLRPNANGLVKVNWTREEKKMEITARRRHKNITWSLIKSTEANIENDLWIVAKLHTHMKSTILCIRNECELAA